MHIEAIRKGEKVKVIALDGDLPVGVCDVRREKPIEAHGHNASFGLAVRKAYRGQDLGKKVLKKKA